MRLTITIAMDNAAFGETEAERSSEVARILDGFAEDLRGGFPAVPGASLPLRDVNGNHVGGVEILTD